jgi:YidC/Oxa1 family membrane protein insertase
METRRLLLFLAVSFGFVLIWQKFLADKPQNAAPQVADQKNASEEEDQAADDSEPLEEAAATTSSDDGSIDSADEHSEPAESAAVVHPRKEIVLGSSDDLSNYAIEVIISTEGAAITSVRLADPLMLDLTNRKQQVQVLGNNGTDHQTFSTSLDVIDEQLEEHSPGMSLETIDWDVRRREPDSVTLSYVSPNGTIEVEKTYRVQPVTAKASEKTTALRSEPAAYTVQCELIVRNQSDQSQEVQYEILGPCGVILENKEHTRKYRDIKLEFLEDGSSDVFTAANVQTEWEAHPGKSDQEISDFVRDGENKWIEPVRYAGVDVQFFAALIALDDDRPAAEQISDRWIERVWPILLKPNKTSTLADITFRMASTPRTLEADESIKHSYLLFVGPKHGPLLDPPPFEAEEVLDYGSYFGFIARGMHSVLSFLYGLGLPYWLAIISLTVMVRCCLFPLSRKQAISAARMKDLQPKISELKLKYGDDKEKLAKAQMELWRKHNINPIGGCLPLFFQLPVFIGLYTCLNTAVDLRLSGFLWIDNLAAPDALFLMPFTLPVLGQDFNLLPCINVVLFLVQQKLFMPPPTDEQQEMQQKMMNVMTIFFAVMFWHVPAGLCIYFVASSLWSIGERKLLGSNSLAPPATAEDPEEPDTGKSSAKRIKNQKNAKEEPEADRPKGFMQRIVQRVMEAAETAKEQSEQTRPSGNGKKAGKRKKGK